MNTFRALSALMLLLDIAYFVVGQDSQRAILYALWAIIIAIFSIEPERKQ